MLLPLWVMPFSASTALQSQTNDGPEPLNDSMRPSVSILAGPQTSRGASAELLSQEHMDPPRMRPLPLVLQDTELGLCRVAGSCRKVGPLWTFRDMDLNTSDPSLILRLDVESETSLNQLCPLPLVGGLRTACSTSSNLQSTVRNKSSLGKWSTGTTNGDLNYEVDYSGPNNY